MNVEIMTKDQLSKYYEKHENIDIIKNEIINLKKTRIQDYSNPIESPIIGRYKIIFLNEKNNKLKYLYEYAKNISDIEILNNQKYSNISLSFKLLFSSGSNTLKELITKKDQNGDIILKQINEQNQVYFFLILKEYKINEIKISEINNGTANIIVSIQYHDIILINNE